MPNGEDDFSSNDFGHFQSASTDFGHFPTSRDDSVINDCDNHSSCDDGNHDEKCRKSRQEILAEHNGNAGDEVGLSKSSRKMGGVKTERVFPGLSVLRKNNKMEVLSPEK
jgi:hypothetical protein